ncbi:MAG: glycosyltransferase family 2 protein [Actinomycetota bacterium]
MTETSNPMVSFIVPCYKLAHLLPECVNSILAQTYRDFEILIMDDCSPDNTPEVARSFADPRVIHVRNQPNLGHLRNYNKGIRMARGKYIWLISADDCLRRDYALERYVRVMEEHANVGYAFCAGCALSDHTETGVIRSSMYRREDGIFPGREFLLDLLKGNFILAASGMARKECYEKVSYFPEDMPYGGDWYLWCAYALHYDVAFFADAMVNYRVHDLSMSTIMAQKDMRAIFADIIGLPARMRREGDRIGDSAIVERCRETIIGQYADCLSAKEIRDRKSQISIKEFEESLAGFTDSLEEQREIRRRVFCGAGDRFCWDGRSAESASMYRRALAISPWMPGVWLKLALLKTGNVGGRVRNVLGGVRRLASLKN